MSLLTPYEREVIDSDSVFFLSLTTANKSKDIAGRETSFGRSRCNWHCHVEVKLLVYSG